MSFESDKQLVKAILAGDETAFRFFYDEYVHRIYRFALTRVHQDSTTAQDIAQQTLTKALKKMDSYRGEAQLFTWLCTICRNEAIDWLRRNRKHTEFMVSIDDEPNVRSYIESMHAPPDDLPESVMIRQQRIHLIQIALDQLPQKYGNALEWKYIHGLSVKEIAAKLTLSSEATHSLLARSKRAFSDVYSTLDDNALRRSAKGSTS